PRGHKSRVKRKDGYAAIGDYAALGDGRTVALVARDGSVDFMSLPELHSPTAFAALLDPEQGGRFVLAPEADFEAARRYLGRTNVLETTFRTGEGVVRVTEALTLQDGGLLPWIELARRVEGVEGRVRLRWLVEPRFDWGRVAPRIRRRGELVVAEGHGLQLGVGSWGAGEPQLEDGAIRGEFELAAGEQALLALTCAHDQPLPKPLREHVEARLDATCRVWERWLGMWAYRGPWAEQVARSALALKLLIYAPAGSITAAPTTSLPEAVGGDKNYDYRYAWVRDSAFTLDALMRCGLPEQVQESFAWLLRAVRETAPDLRPFYDIEGGVPERCEELGHLRGWRDSRPVRYGNAAAAQLQLGSWGDLLETADLYVSRGNALDGATAELLARCVDRIAVIWTDEDSGIWELDTRRHYASSKLGAWMALDRALRLVEAGQLPGEHAAAWREQRDRLHDWIEEHCWSERLGAYRGWAGDDALDAGVLRAARMGWPERERLGRTVDAIRESLSAGGPLLWRTCEHVGREGAFVACSFWAVEALARLDRVAEARALMEELLPRANDLGLWSEQIDPESGELLGNFPQGLSHLALINAAGAIEDAEAAR
ncbi:MAG TPA: glycoside hydrolase family 15 protein, partial [Gaiellaceae bacterium]|nr:glycoside hydrolase family 15 protein [Gaiellaceae bacterium]